MPVFHCDDQKQLVSSAVHCNFILCTSATMHCCANSQERVEPTSIEKLKARPADSSSISDTLRARDGPVLCSDAGTRSFRSPRKKSASDPFSCPILRPMVWALPGKLPTKTCVVVANYDRKGSILTRKVVCFQHFAPELEKLGATFNRQPLGNLPSPVQVDDVDIIVCADA